MIPVDTAWNNFIKSKSNAEYPVSIKRNRSPYVSPKCTDIYISTKTKLAYLNDSIDLENIFWKIPVLPYEVSRTGVIKKQNASRNVSRITKRINSL